MKTNKARIFLEDVGENLPQLVLLDVRKLGLHDLVADLVKLVEVCVPQPLVDGGGDEGGEFGLVD